MVLGDVLSTLDKYLWICNQTLSNDNSQHILLCCGVRLSIGLKTLKLTPVSCRILKWPINELFLQTNIKRAFFPNKKKWLNLSQDSIMYTKPILWCILAIFFNRSHVSICSYSGVLILKVLLSDICPKTWKFRKDWLETLTTKKVKEYGRKELKNQAQYFALLLAGCYYFWFRPCWLHKVLLYFLVDFSKGGWLATHYTPLNPPLGQGDGRLGVEGAGSRSLVEAGVVSPNVVFEVVFSSVLIDSNTFF